MAASELRRVLGIALLGSLAVSCASDPLDDLKHAALRIDVSGIDPRAMRIHVVVVNEAGERHDLLPGVRGPGDTTLYVAELGVGRFALQLEVQDEQGEALQCRRHDGEHTGAQTVVDLLLESGDQGACATVAGCLGADPPVEDCNGLDDDCDGLADDGLGEYVDGVGQCECVVPSCAGGAPQTCTPGSPTVERCNGLDDDCDGTLPPDERDADGDDVMACGPCGDDAVVACGDCDDAEPLRAPGRPETCDGIDNDCNGLVDDGLTCP